jgi:ATP-binding cassette, subfamily B, bacterial
MDPAELQAASVSRKTLRRAWSFARRYRAKLIGYLATIAATAVVAAIPPLVFKALVDHALPRKSMREVVWLFVAAVGLAIVNTGLSLLGRWYGSFIGEGLIFDLRVALYEHVQRMPVDFFTRTQTGSLLSRLSSDVLGAQQTVGTLATVISDALGLVTVLAAMLYLSWPVTIAALFVVPAFIVIDRRLGRRLAALSRRRMIINADMSSTMTERFNVAGATLVKLFGRPRRESAEFAERAGAVRDSGVELAIAGRIYYGTLALVGSLGVAAVYLLGGRAVIHGSLTIGALVALSLYVQRLYEPLTDLASARVDLLTSLVSFDRVFEVLDAPVAIRERPDAVSLSSPTGSVEVEDVWFRYAAASEVSIASLESDASRVLGDQPSDWILRGVSFRAEPGQMVALVGPSGAGKTTLTSLIPRLHDATEGAVRIDGLDVRDLTLQSLSDAIGVVSQDPHLFHDTIGANLRYAKPNATDEELVAACEAARIHEVIAALPEGYETVVGERGYRLSGGEKQRLAIARVLLKDPAIVILDEATSHLDSENEALIQRALAAALTNRTSIVIAHRLSTIRAADQILVIDGGRIVQRGTHASLVDGGGLYAELYETQLAPSAAKAAEVETVAGATTP